MTLTSIPVRSVSTLECGSCGAGAPVEVLRVAAAGQAAAGVVVDTDGLLTQRYDLQPGTVYLFRPDQHVCARWRAPTAAQVQAALQRALAIARRSHRPWT